MTLTFTVGEFEDKTTAKLDHIFVLPLVVESKGLFLNNVPRV
jgi:hypothetical protein